MLVLQITPAKYQATEEVNFPDGSKGRMLVITDPHTGIIVNVPVDHRACDDLAGQLQGKAPRPQVEVAAAVPPLIG